MIDPCNCIDYERTDDQMEEFFLYCIFAANKNADRTAQALDFILRQGEPGDSPFEAIKRMFVDGTLMTRLVQSRCGEYSRRFKTMSEVAGGLVPNLRTAEPEDLEQIHGVGPKTARLFIMFTRKDANYAALDVHILRHLRDVGFINIPAKTPSNPKEYRRIEELFLADAWLNGKTPADHDLEIWTYYSGRDKMANARRRAEEEIAV